MTDDFEVWGTVESTKESEKKSGFFTFKINGTYYGYHAEGANRPYDGDSVHIKGVVNGKFNNVSKGGFEILKKGHATTEEKETPDNPARDLLILRQVAFKKAVDLEVGTPHMQTADSVKDEQEKIRRILRNAEIFDLWLQGKITAKLLMDLNTAAEKALENEEAVQE